MANNENVKKPLLGNQLYDQLKHLAQIGLPAAGTLYFTLSQIWNFPAGEEVVGTIVAVDAFLGVLLGYSSRSYHASDEKFDGFIDVVEGEEKKLFSLELNGDPEDLETKSEVLFKVRTT